MGILAGGSPAIALSQFGSPHACQHGGQGPHAWGRCSVTELCLILTCYSLFKFMFVRMCLREHVYVFVSVCACEREYLCAHACVWMQVCVSEGACVEVRSELAGRGSLHVNSWIQMRWAGLVARPLPTGSSCQLHSHHFKSMFRL